MIKSFKLNYRITDHYCLFLKIKYDTNYSQHQKISKKIKYKKLLQLGYRVNWYEILMYSDMNQATDWIVEKNKIANERCILMQIL